MKHFLFRKASLRDKSLKGFTLIEMLVVLIFIGFLLAMVVPRLARTGREAAVTTSLNEMKSIKEAIRDRFYPDLGFIPEDLGRDGLPGTIDDMPEYSLKYLCLRNNGSVIITWNPGPGMFSYGPAPVPEQSLKMAQFLAEKLRVKLGAGNESAAASQAENLLNWDKYSRKGWQGPYLEQEMTAYDDFGTPADPADDKWYPVILDSWGKSVDSSIDTDKVIGEYHIIYDEIDGISGITREDERLSARIVSFGANREDDGGTTTPLPLPVDVDDDLVMFIFGTGPIRRP